MQDLEGRVLQADERCLRQLRVAFVVAQEVPLRMLAFITGLARALQPVDAAISAEDKRLWRLRQQDNGDNGPHQENSDEGEYQDDGPRQAQQDGEGGGPQLEDNDEEDEQHFEEVE